MASRRQQKPRSPVPANYGLVRVPREVIIRRLEEGARLRREIIGGTELSVYEARGLISVG